MDKENEASIKKTRRRPLGALNKKNWKKKKEEAQKELLIIEREALALAAKKKKDLSLLN